MIRSEIKEYCILGKNKLFNRENQTFPKGYKHFDDFKYSEGYFTSGSILVYKCVKAEGDPVTKEIKFIEIK